MSTGRRPPGIGGIPGRTDHGQTTVMILGFAVVLLMLVVVVVDASAAFLRRQSLSSLADGAALAAADGIAAESVYAGGLGRHVDVDPAAAASLTSGYLASVGAASRYPGLTHQVRVAGPRVVVRVAAPLDLPFPVPGVPRRATVSTTAAAVVTVGD